MEQAKKDQIIKKLTEKGAVKDCPRCGHKAFTLIDGYFNQTLQNDLTGFVLGGPSVPVAVVACNNCGYLSQHALGVLGLLSTHDQEKQDDK
jgi:DNA-directed RNA polymerase subunit RPC12/RpoP